MCKPIAFMYGRDFNSKSEKKRYERLANEVLLLRQQALSADSKQLFYSKTQGRTGQTSESMLANELRSYKR